MLIDSPDITGSLIVDGEFHLPAGPTSKRPSEPFTGSLRFNTDSGSLELYNGVEWSGVEGGGGGTGAGFPYSGSAVITGSLYVSGGNISGSFVGDGAGLTGININQYATVEDTFTNATSHSVVHNFGTKNVFIQVFESDDTLLIPYSVTTTDENTVDIVLGDTLSGRVVIGKAGHIIQDTGNFVSSSTVVQTFTNVLTASIDHHLDSLNVITQVFDTNNNVIVPSNIKVQDSNTVKLTFASQRSGKVVIAKAGHIVQGTSENAVSSSFATTSSFSDISKRVRAGSSGSRPTDYVNIETGSLWYNTDTLALEAFTGVSGSWWQSIGSASLAAPLPTEYNINYLVVAGGGGGGTDQGGGGGGGGFLSSSFADMTVGTVITLTVGAGGAGGPTGANAGFTGDNSTITTDSITITALGGGGGAGLTNKPGLDGGSGGGGAAYWTVGGDLTGGTGTNGQGFDGGTGSTSSGTSGGGGGGGASEAGANAGIGASASNGGNGGAGKSSTITGNLITYAGGGGGGTYQGDISGIGGAGGGGNGLGPASSGTAGAIHTGDVNTGGGGGGGLGNSTVIAGAGGSGVIILRLPTANYTGTTTGSPTVTTNGSDTILTYTQSGTYTA